MHWSNRYALFLIASVCYASVCSAQSTLSTQRLQTPPAQAIPATNGAFNSDRVLSRELAAPFVPSPNALVKGSGEIADPKWWQSRTAHVFMGMAVGAIAGATSAVLSERNCRPTPPSDVPCGLGYEVVLVADTLIGALIGGVVGALLPTATQP